MLSLAELKKDALGDVATGIPDAHLQRLLDAAASDVEARASGAPDASKDRVTVLLVALDIAHSPGIRAEQLGSLRIEYSSVYDRERERLLRSLTRSRGARMVLSTNE